jgi:predicted nucleotidyltransferase component of viral defense system
MNLSAETLSQMQTETGFRSATLEKVIRLGELARQITAHPFLGPRLLLKGGTAIQLGLNDFQ